MLEEGELEKEQKEKRKRKRESRRERRRERKSRRRRGGGRDLPNRRLSWGDPGWWCVVLSPHAGTYVDVALQVAFPDGSCRTVASLLQSAPTTPHHSRTI